MLNILQYEWGKKGNKNILKAKLPFKYLNKNDVTATATEKSGNKL